MEKFKAMTNEILVLEGVDKPSVRSLFTPNTRFIGEVVEEGFAGGNVVHATFQGTDAGRSGAGEDQRAKSTKSAARWPTTSPARWSPPACWSTSRAKAASWTNSTTSSSPRSSRKKSAPSTKGPNHSVHIIGFAKAVGDIASGAGRDHLLRPSPIITAILMFWFVGLEAHADRAGGGDDAGAVAAGHCRSWATGIDPLSILVPFLIFSIGVSHAVQMTKDPGSARWCTGSSSLAAAKVPRSPASSCRARWRCSLTNVLGFAVIMLIPIDIVRELGITASLGVAWMIITNKMLLPILLSHLSMSKDALGKEVQRESRVDGLWTAPRCVENRAPQ